MGELLVMFLILSSLLLLAGAPAQAQGPELAGVEEAASGLRACGLLEITGRYDNEIQSDMLVVDDPSPPDEGLACAAEVAISTGHWVVVTPGSQESYFAHYSRISRERNREWARTRLARQGLLANVPEYVAGESDDRAMAARLEELCGSDAQKALQSEYGPHAISPSWAAEGDRNFERTGEVLSCLMTYAAAAGFELGFIGNEKVVEAE